MNQSRHRHASKARSAALVADEADERTQTRILEGHLAVIFDVVPPLLREGAERGVDIVERGAGAGAGAGEDKGQAVRFGDMCAVLEMEGGGRRKARGGLWERARGKVRGLWRRARGRGKRERADLNG